MCPGIRQRLDLSKVLALALELPLAVCLDIGAGVGWAKSWNTSLWNSSFPALLWPRWGRDSVLTCAQGCLKGSGNLVCARSTLAGDECSP
mmetsp:Transcript_67390/g.140816  ORF Transcript_67390/g.140816 Transcript_67390/m.140816 type:complete len:90 (-) Transcript_67390:580-849(-)|eukprot:CAMPEP_0206505936 /NCGR_PEP_ID=MMETSP0324_2-20121206/56454_1 /ASSEMBLY_ACC=CAM_ASM_000836 /TAXON_ID=2866 /ORGANISM="Crypthecodinium cohnii, Strain Seligo" /LENGTH=89 /DNA_ID=CAMNT_0053995545 /DNA_START=379 /DNA_END=648 /DNA_ORIENTATION=+